MTKKKLFYIYKKLNKYSEFKYLCSIIYMFMNDSTLNNEKKIYIHEYMSILSTLYVVYFILKMYGEEKFLKVYRKCEEMDWMTEIEYNGIYENRLCDMKFTHINLI